MKGSGPIRENQPLSRSTLEKRPGIGFRASYILKVVQNRSNNKLKFLEKIIKK
jgi:hypothetical protein